jgi:hypothetical protein
MQSLYDVGTGFADIEIQNRDKKNPSIKISVIDLI